MRWTLSLVPLLMLSGCLAAGPDPTDAQDGSGEGAQVIVHEGDDAGEASNGLRQGVVFYNEPYVALPNDVLEFEVQVPEGARNVHVEVSVTGAATPLDEAVVSLSSCGSAKVSWNPGPNVNIVISGGGSWREGDLCGVAGAGTQTVTFDSGLTPMTGQLLLRADLP